MKHLFILLLLAFSAYGQQQKRVAIINTVDDEEQQIKLSELNHLTNRLREIAVKILPQESYAVMTTESIFAFFGSQERMQKECKEATCLVDLGRKVSADYVAQASIGRFGKNLAIKVELYDTRSGSLISLFTGVSKDVFDLLSVLDKEAPGMFGKMLGVSGGSGKSFTDVRDGREYKMVVIGKQTWMAENLNYNASGSKCYDNKPANCDQYGRLYNWETAMKACPKGWHLPSKSEYGKLDDFVGGENTAGKFLRATSGWNENGNGTDKYGFSALPGGLGSFDGSFEGVSMIGNWWGASEYNSSNAYSRDMFYFSEYFNYDYYNKNYLYSVRCLQD